MLLGHWHHLPVEGAALGTHIHGRDLVVSETAGSHRWHWCVRSPHGCLLAQGDAPTCQAAEEAAEAEALAVHPPTDALLDRLLS
jgi:hypothetical protein